MMFYLARPLSILVAVVLFSSLGAAQTTARPPRASVPPAPARNHDARAAAQIAAAERLLERKNYAEAAGRLKEALATDTENAHGWYLLGFSLAAQGDKPSAVQAYTRAVQLRPQHFESTLNLGLLYASLGDSQAERFLRKALELQPEGPAAPAKAAAVFALARVLDAKSPDEALELYNQAAELAPRPEYHIYAAALCERRKDFACAVSEYNAALRLDAASKPAIAGLANAYIAAGDTARAEPLVRRLIQADPADSAPRLHLVRLLLAQGKPEDARRELAPALATPDAARKAAALFAGSGLDAAQQLAIYQQVLAAHPGLSDVRHDYARLLMRQKRWQEANVALLEIAKAEPQNPAVLSDLAAATFETRNYPGALAVLDRLRTLQPDTPGTLFLRALSLDHLKRPRDAAKAYKEFLAAAGGKFPEQEWQARHRINALTGN